MLSSASASLRNVINPNAVDPNAVDPNAQLQPIIDYENEIDMNIQPQPDENQVAPNVQVSAVDPEMNAQNVDATPVVAPQEPVDVNREVNVQNDQATTDAAAPAANQEPMDAVNSEANRQTDRAEVAVEQMEVDNQLPDPSVQQPGQSAQPVNEHGMNLRMNAHLLPKRRQRLGMHFCLTRVIFKT